MEPEQNHLVGELNDLAREIDTNNTEVIQNSPQADRAREIIGEFDWADPDLPPEKQSYNRLLGTHLSNREVEVVEMKRRGFTHGAIALVISASEDFVLFVSESTPNVITKSTVDEYSRRAKNKYEESLVLVDLLDAVFGDK